MHASLLKRTCRTLLITTMLTSSLMTQGFAMEKPAGGVQRQNAEASKASLSPAVQNLKTTLTRRTNAYNVQPDNLSIPRDTSEINRIYQSVPSDRHANDAEREALIKGLMFTAGIHGAAMPLDVSNQASTGSTLNALQKHYAIIHAVDVLSRDYFVNDIFSSKEDLYALLQNYAGLEKEKINRWLGYAKQELTTGRALSNRKYWWAQRKCDAALRGDSVAVEVDEMESTLPAEQLRVYAPITRAELTPDVIRPGSVDEFLKALDKVNNAVRDEVGRLALQFIRPKMSSYEVALVVKLLADFTGDRSEFVAFALQFITECMNGMWNVSGIWRLGIITALSRINVSDRTQEFIDQMQQLIAEHLVEGAECIIHDFSRVNVADRPAFITQVQQLITKQMGGGERLHIIGALSCVNAADRTQEFIDQVQQLITEQMGGWQRSHIIKALSRVASADRAAFITQVQQLVTKQMDGDERLHIIGALSSVNVANRANTVARALLFMRNGNHAVLRQVLETRLDQEIMLGDMAAVAQGVNPYAAGMNVHAAGRDQRTIEAVQRLTEYWSPTQENVNHEFNDFWQAVQALPNKALQQRLLRALGVTLDGTAIVRSSHDFGGLLTGYNGQITLTNSSHTLRMNARELIARFWHFANNYMPEEVLGGSASASAASSRDLVTIERERGNIRTAIMNGLAEGLQKDTEASDHVVCDPGKIQRLVMGTINGRLRLANGLLVDIDNVGLVNQGAAGEPHAAPAAAPRAAPAVVVAPMIRNLDEIAQYLQPFMDNLGHNAPQNGNEFFTRLFEYRNALADGRVPAFGGQRINLDPHEVVYYVRMMSPISEGGKIVRYDINPRESLVALLGFDDFQVNDYMHQFGARDQAQLAQARRIEAERALRAQQDREYAEGLQQDLKRQQQNLAIERERPADDEAHPTQEQLRALRVKALEEKG